MKGQWIVYVVALLVAAVLAAANWPLLLQPIAVNLVFVTMSTTLGVAIAMAVAIPLLLDLAVYGWTRSAWRREHAGLSRRLEQTRLRADSADESRIYALRESMERELTGVRIQLDRLTHAIIGPEESHAAAPLEPADALRSSH